MKKLILVIMIIFTIVGCQKKDENNKVVEEIKQFPLPEWPTIYGNLKVEKKINDLTYYTANFWEEISDDKNVATYTVCKRNSANNENNFILTIEYIDNYHGPILDEDKNQIEYDYNYQKENMQFLDWTMVSNYNVPIAIEKKDNVVCYFLSIYDDVGTYFVRFYTFDRNLYDNEIQYVYDYAQVLSLEKQLRNHN